MDLAYWGFHQWPFDCRKSRGGGNIGASHEEALARLMFLVDERRRCGMLTGAAGIGKSRLFWRVRSEAMRHGRLCIEIDATAIDSNEFVSQLAERMYIDVSAAARYWPLVQEQMAALALVKQPIVVLIDHFDLVEFGCSQAIRRLMHLADSTGVDLTVLIAARERFTAPLLLDVVELSVELTPWTRDETAQFVADAIHDAGVNANLFTGDAIDSIQKITRGIPAEVVWLCDLCLLAAEGREDHQIDSDLVVAAAMELSPREWMLAEYGLVHS